MKDKTAGFADPSPRAGLMAFGMLGTGRPAGTIRECRRRQTAFGQCASRRNESSTARIPSALTNRALLRQRIRLGRRHRTPTTTSANTTYTWNSAVPVAR